MLCVLQRVSVCLLVQVLQCVSVCLTEQGVGPVGLEVARDKVRKLLCVNARMNKLAWGRGLRVSRRESLSFTGVCVCVSVCV